MSCHFAPGSLRLLGSGSALPGKPVSNDQLLRALADRCGDNAARRATKIVRQLGISHRHLSRHLDRGISEPQVDNPALGCQALALAFDNAGTGPNELTYLLGHTATPHTLIPPNIAWIAERLDCAAPYMELRQACTGFANALQIASAMLNDAAPASRIAMVGSEVGSVYFDMQPDFIDIGQLVNVVQMGDGAGAVVVAPLNSGDGPVISDIYTGHIGNGKQPGLHLQGGGSGSVACPKGLPRFIHHPRGIREQGAALFEAGVAAIESRGYSIEEFDWVLPHQVNGHLAALLSEGLGIAAEKVVVDADQLGNLGSAAIWVSLDRLRRSGKLKPRDKVLVLGAEATKYIYGGFIYHHNGAG